MDGETLHIGTKRAAWQIKDFSVALRQAITETARRQDATVAEWLHAHFTRYGVGELEVQPQQTLPEQTTESPGAPDELTRLAQLAVALDGCGDGAAVTLAKGIIADRLRALRADPPWPTIRLPAPARRIANSKRTPDSARVAPDSEAADGR